MTDPIHDPFEVLGLHPGATPDEVRRRYKDLAVQHHPDRNSEPASAETFKRIAAAYAILNDPVARKKWEQQRGYAGYEQSVSGEGGLREHQVQSATRRSVDPSERRRREKFAREFAEAMARGPEDYIWTKSYGASMAALGWILALIVLAMAVVACVVFLFAR